MTMTRAAASLILLGVALIAPCAHAQDKHPQAKARLAGVWKLDRDATLKLQRQAGDQAKDAGEATPEAPDKPAPDNSAPDKPAPKTAAQAITSPAPDVLPDFDFEMRLQADGSAELLTTVVGDQQRKLAKWSVVRLDADGSGELDLLFPRGLAKRCAFQLEQDILQFRAPGAEYELVLTRQADPPAKK